MEQKNVHKSIIGLLIALVIVVLFVVYKQYAPTPSPSLPDTNKVGTTPAPAISGDTGNFVSFSIAPGAKVSGKMTATGSVKGAYFFEANLVMQILDANKNVLRSFPGSATTDWMTSEPVSFTTDLDFTGLAKGPGYIRIHNDNPSGLPENDRSIDIPVTIE